MGRDRDNLPPKRGEVRKEGHDSSDYWECRKTYTLRVRKKTGGVRR